MSKAKKTQPDYSKWFAEYDEYLLKFAEWKTQKDAYDKLVAAGESGSNPGNPPPPPPPPPGNP